jgi:hypothetical protein
VQERLVESEVCGRREFLARSVAFALGASLFARTLPARAAGAEVRAGLDQNSTILIDERPFFPFISWKANVSDIPNNLALGVNTFMGSATGDEATLAQAVARAGAYYVASYDPTRAGDLPGTIGYYLPDEPDNNGELPAALPQTQRVSTTGKLVFETFSHHYWAGAADPPVGSKAVYPPYFANVDVIGTDVYPYAKFCGNKWISGASVFDLQHALVQQANGKPTFQWIETTPLGGLCADPANPQLTAARIRAELWDAVAGGAKGLGLFTWANQGGTWGSFVVAPEIQQQIKTETGRIAALTDVLMSPPLPVRARPQSPLRASARVYGGQTYVIAVNNSPSPVTTSFAVPGLRSRTASLWQESRSVKVNRGQAVSDRFDPYGVHIYIS